MSMKTVAIPTAGFVFKMISYCVAGAHTGGRGRGEEATRRKNQKITGDDLM